MSGQPQRTMFGGRNKKRAKKRQERNRQHNKQRRERKVREQLQLAQQQQQDANDGDRQSTASSVDTLNEVLEPTDAAVAAALKAKGYDVEGASSQSAAPESKMSRSKRKKLEKISAEREKKKHRSELFAKLAANALSVQQQSMLQSTATLGQKQTMRQRLRADLRKQRAGMEVDETTSRLEVQRQPIAALSSPSSSSFSSGNLGKWSAPGVVAPPRQAARPFGVSSESDNDSTSDEEEVSNSDADADVNMKSPNESSEWPALSKVDPMSAALAKAASLERPSRPDKKSLPVALDSVTSGGKRAQSSPAATGNSTSESKAFYVHLNRTSCINEARSKLPVCGMEQEIMEAISENPFVVLCGETGSGKTTQVPQFLYEAGYGSPGSGHPGMIGVTQPRRVAALAVARRVAEEMNVPYGGKGGKVAHQVRYDARTVGDSTAIKFMTDGILLKEIQSDFLLRKYSAIILDEAHERNVNTDMLLGLLSRIVPLRSNLFKAQNQDNKEEKEVDSELKVIIMSATLRVEDFTENRALFPSRVPPVLRVQGRTHPVTVHFARRTVVGSDYLDAVFMKVSKIHRLLPPGGILVFLTGQREIEALCKRLRAELGVGGKAAGQAVWGRAEDAAQLAIDEADVDWSAGESGDEVEDEEEEEDVSSELTPMTTRPSKTGDSEELELVHETDDEEEGGVFADSDQRKDIDVVIPQSTYISNSTNTTRESSSSVQFENDVPCFDKNSGELNVNEGSGSSHLAALTGVHVLPLYARLSQKRQSQIFEDVPEGRRLIVVATNVAETSITIPGIRYVVDAGRQKDKIYDMNTGLSRFAVQWVSKSSAEQRSGRAGRVGPGHAYRMYSSAVFNDRFNSFAPPEIVNRPIEDLVLQMKAMSIENVSRFPFPTPPSEEEMKAAIQVLVCIGALDIANRITPLGMAISKFPVAARYAKMLILAKQRDILPYMIAVVAGMTVQPPYLPVVTDNKEEKDDDGNEVDEDIMDKQKRQKKSSKEVKNPYSVHRKWRHSQSDHLGLLRVIGAYSHTVETAQIKHKAENPRKINAAVKRAASKFCKKHHLHERTLREISLLRRQLRSLAQNVLNVSLPTSLKLRPPSPDQEQLLSQLIAAGLLDRVAMLAPAGTFPISEGSRDLIDEGDTEARRRALRRLRAAYQSCVPSLRRTPLFIPPSSFVREKEVKRLPQFVCYNSIVRSSSGDGVNTGKNTPMDSNSFVHMQGLTAVAPEWLSSISSGTSLCNFPAPDAATPPMYNSKSDCIMCTTRPRFGAHCWELPLTTVPMSRTSMGLEQECRWFLRFLLEGKIGASTTFKELRSKLKISPAVITHSRFHALGLSLVNEAMACKITNKKTVLRELQRNEGWKFLLPQLKLWAKGGAVDRIQIEKLWKSVAQTLLQ